MPTYPVRAPLAKWLRHEAAAAHRRYGQYRLLDVGCGDKPYQPIFEPFARKYVGVDPVDNPRADIKGAVESLPIGDGEYDVVLCAQVLEHCDEPPQAVRELHRVTAPGGRVLASTHGVMVYHPSPVDYWRWTHTGLERLFQGNGNWASVKVTPACGTTASLAMLVSIYLDLAFRRAHVGLLRKPVIAAINQLAEALDRRSSLLREPRPGTLHANYHVLAEKA
jgi:SAM-dependent methyltransferase